MEPALLAQLLLLGGTLFGATVLVRGYISRLARERSALERFVRGRAGETHLTSWGSGYRYGVEGDRTGVRSETFTRGTARGGVVDVWTVQRERSGFVGAEWALTRRGAKGKGPTTSRGRATPPLSSTPAGQASMRRQVSSKLSVRCSDGGAFAACR